MIHVEVKENKKENDFPKLMISNESMIVLFRAISLGMVLKSSNKSYSVGYYSNAWKMDNFQDFDGEITLKNQ